MDEREQRQAQATYPALCYLLSAYFHQDWEIEGETSTAVVKRFAAEARPSLVVDARRELEGLLAENRSELELRRLVWSGLLCFYYPMGFGLQMSEWLAELHSDLVRQRPS